MPMSICRLSISCLRETGAVLCGRERHIFSDPNKINPINHQGTFFRVPGIHLCEPSPQRTPVLYQAGASNRGKAFAEEHAECVFVAAPSKVLLKKTVADIRQRVAEVGRDPRSILIFNLQMVIVGETDLAAQAKSLLPLSLRRDVILTSH